MAPQPKAVDETLVPHAGNKIGAIKNFHSLAPQAQLRKVPIGKLRGYVNGGYYAQVDEARAEFSQLARELTRRMAAKKSSAAA